jgi:hypothetical protein
MQQEAAEIISYYGGEMREDYSGRGMYGASTHAVVFDSFNDFLSAVGAIMQNCDEEECNKVGTAMHKVKTDSMGTGIVIY